MKVLSQMSSKYAGSHGIFTIFEFLKLENREDGMGTASLSFRYPKIAKMAWALHP